MLKKSFSINIKKHIKSSKPLLKSYHDYYKKSINPETRETFWKEQAQELNWSKFPNKILDSSSRPFYKWFPDGEINLSYNCIDRHILNNQGETTAIIYESAYNTSSQPILKYTYNELLTEVSKLSHIFTHKYNLTKGDTVLIYMPNIPEALFSMLACVRLGLIHCVVFGGFAAEEVGLRIRHCKPKLIITASVGIEPKKRIPYLPILKQALEIENCLSEIPILLYQRENFLIEKNFSQEKDNVSIYQEEFNKLNLNYKKYSDFTPAVNLNSNDPSYILYTSGTTGSPKGVCRDTGGTCVALNYAMKNIMGINRGDVYFATSDIGWVVGHSFIVYAPLIRGVTTLLYEGKPIGTPHCGKFWELAEKHNVRSMFSSPTALRAIKKEDNECKIMKKYNLSNLQSLHVAGERCDADTIEWINKGLNNGNGNILINDNWWQTETGWPMASNYMDEKFALVPGSVCKPCPGYDIKIVDEKTDKEIQEPNILGKIYVKLPLPPSFMLSLWESDDQFIEKYISKDGVYYITGDAGHFDENGYLFIQTRIDDIINVAGHRLSTGRIEEVLCGMHGIIEAAVVGVKDQVKGEVPFAFIVIDICMDINNVNECNEVKLVKMKELKENAKNTVATHIGAIARLQNVAIVNKLPKTRSGKILRGMMKKILNNESYIIPSSIEDTSVIDEICRILKNEKYIK